MSTSGARASRRPGTLEGMLLVPRDLFASTFELLRTCGAGHAECQVLWIGSWSDPSRVTEIVHPFHHAHRGGFTLDDGWLTSFWRRLAHRNEGIWAQVHTHPREAFHSATDDAWPIVHLEHFLSLVIPDFALGPVSLDRSFLAELDGDGRFREANPRTRLRLI